MLYKDPLVIVINCRYDPQAVGVYSGRFVGGLFDSSGLFGPITYTRQTNESNHSAYRIKRSMNKWQPRS